MKRDNFRINFVVAILFIAMSILLLASIKLMVVDGAEYRETSDTKRIKDVYTNAPRGDILDRNGKVLATTMNSFTVQLYADELKGQNSARVNADLGLLISLLEEDGVNYGEDNPIVMYAFTYKDQEDYIKEDKLAEDLVVDLILEEDLVKDFLQLSSQDPSYSNAARAINVLETRSQDQVPIRVSLDGGIKISYKEEALDEEETYPEDPIDYLAGQIEAIESKEAVIGNILSHPLARKLTYDMLKEKGLADKLDMAEFAYKDDLDYLHNKASLAKEFDGIDLESDPIDDFVEVSSSNLKLLLASYSQEEGEEEPLIPADELIRLVEREEGQDIQIQAEIKDGQVVLSYEEGVSAKETPADRLVRLAKEAGVLKEFFTDDDIKFLAQDANTKAGDTPQISVLDWDYIFVKNKADMMEKYGIKKEALAEEALEGIVDYYEISNNSSFEQMRMAGLLIDLDKQGYRSFEPVIVTYGLQEETVAKIEEQIFNPGIELVQEPVRYYPEGTTAAHVLGYMGKISQPDELQKYVEGLDYANNDIIGKTGIEESYETSLKGKDGKKVVQVDSAGNTTNVLEETPPVKGNNLYLTLDYDLQKVAEESLSHALSQLRVGGNFKSKWGEAPLRINESEGRPHYNAKSGAVVVLDVKTGEVLALANESTYDPNLFATGISQADWKSLFPEDEDNPLADRPLVNIAMQTEVAPGSTFKLVPALAALENGQDPYDQIQCTGYVEIGDHVFGCWIYNQYGGAHGYENIFEAIRDSCNYYFYALAMGGNPDTGETNIQLDVNDIREFASKLGLDGPTGIEINIPYESTGHMPNPDEKLLIVKNQLADFMEANIEDYVKEDVSLNPDSKAEMVSQLVDLVDLAGIDYVDFEDRLDEIGIDASKEFRASGESIGKRIYYSYLNQASWNITDMLNVVIGQGQNSYTPLQMANMIATIANGGYNNKLTLIREVRSGQGNTSLLKNEPVRERISLNNYENLAHIREGMNMASHFGSIEQVYGDFPVEIGLKTGTAERAGTNPETGLAYDDYSWMVAFAPYEDPEIAICTLLYESGSGSNGAPIVREIVGEYLGLEPEDPSGSNFREEGADQEALEDEASDDQSFPEEEAPEGQGPIYEILPDLEDWVPLEDGGQDTWQEDIYYEKEEDPYYQEEEYDDS